METTDSCRKAETTFSTTLVFPDAVPPATPMKKGSWVLLSIFIDTPRTERVAKIMAARRHVQAAR